MDPGATSPGQGHPERYHSLDALRAFALLLGVAFHAAESFEPGVADYWAIEDASASAWFAVFRHASHSFRMEVFFLIAGFFARLLYHRRGPLGFWRNRLQRIVVPLVVGWAILYPLLVSVWLWGASVSGQLEAFGVPAEHAGTPIWLLTAGFFATLQFLNRFDLTHLWFLHQLLIVYAGWLGLRWIWLRLVNPAGSGRAWVDRRFAALCTQRWSLPLFAAATVPILMLMNSLDVDTPKSSLWPHVPCTLHFGLLFGVGWLWHRQPRLLQEVSRPWRWHLGLALLLVAPTWFGPEWARPALAEHGGMALFRWLYSCLYALMMWGFVLGCLGLFMRYWQGHSPAWRYVADSSYWIYLVHLPLVVCLQVTVGRAPYAWWVKYPLILGVAVPVLFASYHYGVRSTFIGSQLNGRRYPFHNPLQDPAGRWAWAGAAVGLVSIVGWLWVQRLVLI